MMQNLVIGDFLPNITLIFDADVEICMKRAEVRGEKENRYEKMGMEFHKRVRQGFLETAKTASQRCSLVNANDELSNIHQKVIEVINHKTGLLLKKSL